MIHITKIRKVSHGAPTVWYCESKDKKIYNIHFRWERLLLQEKTKNGWNIIHETELKRDSLIGCGVADIEEVKEALKDFIKIDCDVEDGSRSEFDYKWH